jgi:hypothetical protein
VLYNNKRLKVSDLSEDIMQIRDYGILYLKISIIGDGVLENLKKHAIFEEIADIWIKYSNYVYERGRVYNLDEILKFYPEMLPWMFADKEVKISNRKVMCNVEDQGQDYWYDEKEYQSKHSEILDSEPRRNGNKKC